jgi:N-acetyl-anhydromuramyl-L-alanine amidase AmpD
VANGSSLIMRGESVPCAATVRTWHEHGLRYTGLAKRTGTFYVVNHWTGSENPPPAVYSNVRKRALSIHFVIDRDGTVWQFADADDRCAHAGVTVGNAFGLGIEIINRAHETGVPTYGVVRPLRKERIHGRELIYAGFLPAQIEAAVALNEALCNAYGLPMRVPMLPDASDVSAAVLTPPELRKFRGCLPHSAFKADKMDCGLELLRALHARGLSRELPVG